jgi:hypothetical protein
MALEAYTNDGTGAVISGGTGAPASGTVETWTVSVTVAFPVASATASPPTQFYIADQAASGELEKVLITACPGGTGTQTWTVTRGADGSSTTTHASGFTVQQVITGASLRGVQRAGLPIYYATDFGVKADGGTTDNGPILNAAFKTLWNSGNGQGGIILLPQAGFMAGGNTAVTVSSTVIIPPYCGLVGMGKQKTMLRLAAGANCDLIQFMAYNSSYQAGLLGVTATTLQNCFYGLIRGLTLHGSWNFQTPTDYHHCINAQPNPLLTTAAGDPDFDPYNLIDDVEVRYASGDGLFANGRSGLQVSNFLARYCQGNGITPSFDSLFSNVDSGFNGITGIYMNHGSTSGDGKLYNNGTIPAWVSGTSYTVGTRVTYTTGGVLAVYACIVATSGTTAPPSDTGHWTAITAYTSPQAFGWDLYLDSNTYENRWDIDSQEPTAGSVYIKGGFGNTVTGVSNRPNFDNPNTGVQLGTNPNNYAAVTLDGAAGCNVTLGYSAFNSAAYGARLINSTTRCAVTVSGDGTSQAALSSDSATAGNLVTVDGTVQSPLTMAQSATTGVTVLTFSTSMTINAQAGGHFRVTLTASTGVFAAPTNPVDGQKITLEIIQDGTGSRTISSWNSAFDFGSAGTPVLTTTASGRDLLGFVYSASAAKWLFSGITKGL